MTCPSYRAGRSQNNENQWELWTSHYDSAPIHWILPSCSSFLSLYAFPSSSSSSNKLASLGNEILKLPLDVRVVDEFVLLRRESLCREEISYNVKQSLSRPVMPEKQSLNNLLTWISASRLPHTKWILCSQSRFSSLSFIAFHSSSASGSSFVYIPWLSANVNAF